MRTALITIAILVGFYFFAGRHIYQRVAAEVRYRHLYGAEWKAHYSEDRHVTVEEDHQKLLVAAGGVAVAVTLCFLIYGQVAPKRSGRRRSHRRRKSSPLPT